MFASGLGHSDVGLVTPALDLSFGSWAEEIMLVSGLGHSDIGLVTPALDLSFWSWAFGPASFLISNCDCLWTCMLEQNACLSSIWLVIPKHYSAYHIMLVSGLACWDIRLVTPACGLVVWKMGLRPSCILNIELWLFLDLHVTTFDVSLQHRSRHFDCFWMTTSTHDRFWICMLGHWICHCSVGLVILQLGLRPSFILDIKSILALGLHIGIVDLSPRDWTCHSEAVLNLKSGMCLDLRVGTLDFSVRHWTCHFEAGPSAQLHS